MLFGKTVSRQVAYAGLMLVIITLAGVMAHTNIFSLLMLMCLGTPSLLLLLSALLD